MNLDRPRPRWRDEQLVEALVPTPRPVASPEPAPAPTLPAPAARSGDGVLFDVGRPDAAGRVTARALLRALGWAPGLTLHVDVVTGAILIPPAAGGAHVVGAREELPLPADARHLRGIALTGSNRPAVPTVAEYLPAVVAAASPGTRRTYGSSWRRMAAALGERRIDAVRASDLEALMRQVAAGACPRRNSRNGRHAGEHLIAAARAFYNHAIADGYLTAADSPAHRIRKPRRLPNTRRALTPDELSDINAAARSGGNDIVLDALRFACTHRNGRPEALGEP